MKQICPFLLFCFLLAGTQVSAQTNANANSPQETVVLRKNLDFTPYDLRVEYLKSPVGIDEMKPRFSWKIKSNTNGETQTAYKLEVLEKGTKEPVWDSGKIESGELVGIEYAGSELKPGLVYLWKVTTWNKDERESSTVQSQFSTGINEWSGKWIGWDEDPAAKKTVDLSGAFWIWPENANPAPVGKASFRKTFELPEKPIAVAELAFAADNEYKLFLNGAEVVSGTSFKSAQLADIKRHVQKGKNTLALEVTNHGDAPNPAGLVGTVHIRFEDGENFVLKTDASWKSVYGVPQGFSGAGFDDAGWDAAAQVAEYGQGPWGDVSVSTSRESLPARYLRKEFELEQKMPVRATAYISGLGYYELYLNGKKVGDHVLDSILTDYDKRVPYVTYEINPRDCAASKNVIGVILGNGRYYAPRITDPTATRTFGYPKLLFELVLEYKDGSQQKIVSDESWKISTEGPILENNDYDGEIYDARKEIPNWADVKFNAEKSGSLFADVQLVEAPKGKLVAPMMPPMRVIEELKAKSLTEVRPGVWVVDFGQNIVGWCRLRVKGPAGTEVLLRHAETLQTEGPDKGMLYVANLRGAKCRDIYTLKGGTEEAYQPRFVYHGFRYAEITGFPGKPNINTLTACSVNTHLPIVGKFECSNPLINKIYKNIEWGVRDNYLSIPTDCPQRDERQGWQGDRAGEALGEMLMFDNYSLYAKWMQDVEDSQKGDSEKDAGNLSDVCPNYWPLYGSNVTWPSAFTIIPDSLFRMYGDDRPIRRHYEGMKKWMKHLEQFIREDGTIDKDNYGDWCVPPERPELIHSQDPARKTAPGILATTYYINNLKLLSRFATMLGKEEESKGFRDRAEKMTADFNKRFYNAEQGKYDNGTQSSCVLPLAFDIVPKEDESKVFATLVNNIEHVTKDHIGTGLIGGQWLNLILDQFDRNDIAYTFVSNKDYPSWGYMVEKGATTVWELWNGDTADPAMNSGNHVMLVGDLVIWLHTKVAGIPIPEKSAPLMMTPNPGGDLKYVNAEYDSAYGMIKSSWRIAGGKFHYTVTVPVGRTATILLPSDDLDSVREKSRAKFEKSISETTSRSGKTLRRVCCIVPSGTYSFECEYK